MLSPEQKKEVDKFIRKENKDLETNMMMLGDVPPIDESILIKTDIYGLNDALGVGGVPRGGIMELYGPEGAGKTTVALHIIAKAQELGLACHFEDAEHALNLSLAELHGVQINELSFHQPDHGEQGLQVVLDALNSGIFGVVVIDSAAALVPKAVLEKRIDDNASRAALASMLSENIPKLAAAAKRTGTLCIFINQIREKPGVMYGSPEYTPGGRALKFYASIRIECRRGEPIKEGNLQVGHNMKIKVIKNKYAPPFKTSEIRLHYYKGLDNTTGIIEMAIGWGVIDQASSMYYFKTPKWDKKWQGKVNMFAEISQTPELFNDIKMMLQDVIAEAKADGKYEETGNGTAEDQPEQ